jgi:hypothetical protein
MITVYPKNQIEKLDNILKKNINVATFKDIISLIFHSVSIMTKNKPAIEEWELFFSSYQEELKRQNKLNWPSIVLIKNEYNKRIESLPNKPFLKSSHLLILLLRLLYIENQKKMYKNILNHIIDTPDQIKIKNITLGRLFEILKVYVQHYKTIYSDNTLFEYQIAIAIINLL